MQRRDFALATAAPASLPASTWAHARLAASDIAPPPPDFQTTAVAGPRIGTVALGEAGQAMARACASHAASAGLWLTTAPTDAVQWQALFACDVVCLMAGLGDPICSVAAVDVARTIRATGTLVIALATVPPHAEGLERRHRAWQVLATLRTQADIVVPIDLEVVRNHSGGTVGRADVHCHGNDAVAMLYAALTLALCSESWMALDVADLRCMAGGLAVRATSGHGMASGIRRAACAALRSFHHCRHGRLPLAAADHVLVVLVASEQFAPLLLRESRDAMRVMRAAVGSHTTLQYVARQAAWPGRHLHLQWLAFGGAEQGGTAAA